MEDRNFNRGSLFCLVLHLALLFVLCRHFANKYIDGWMDGWIKLESETAKLKYVT